MVSSVFHDLDNEHTVGATGRQGTTDPISIILEIRVALLFLQSGDHFNHLIHKYHRNEVGMTLQWKSKIQFEHVIRK